MSFRFGSSLKVHARLFHPEGPFGSLRTIIDARDGGALAGWLRAQAVDDIESLIHRTAAEVQQQGELMYDYQRTPRYLARLEAVVTAVRKIAAIDQETAQQSEHDIQSARELAREFSALHPAVIAAAQAVANPEGSLVQRAVGDFDLLARWGKS